MEPGVLNAILNCGPKKENRTFNCKQVFLIPRQGCGFEDFPSRPTFLPRIRASSSSSQRSSNSSGPEIGGCEDS